MKKFTKQTGGLFLGLILGLVCLEGYFQVIEFQLPYFTLNEKQGKKMLPSKRITYFGEGFYLGETNQYGYLGTGYPQIKQSQKFRIAMIGDSYVEGLQIFDSFHFSRIAEQKLNKGLKEPRYEVLNFGVGNYNYNDMIISYVNYVKSFQPDIVIFLLKNDDFILTKNFVPSPVLKIDEDSISIDYSFTDSSIFKTYRSLSWVFENSALLYASNNAYKISKRKGEISTILFDKFYTAFADPTPVSAPLDVSQHIDERFLRSFDWLKDESCIFVFRSDIPAAVTKQANQANIDVVNVDKALKEAFSARGIDYSYWKVSGLRGHWNYSAQDFVGDYMYRLIRHKEKEMYNTP